jgi:hypothetical protein
MRENMSENPIGESTFVKATVVTAEFLRCVCGGQRGASVRVF